MSIDSEDWALSVSKVYDDALGVNSGRGVSAEDFLAVLIYRGKLQVNKMLTVFLAQGLHRGFGSERIPRPDLFGETHTKFGEASIPHIVGQHLSRHSHSEHA